MSLDQVDTDRAVLDQPAPRTGGRDFATGAGAAAARVAAWWRANWLTAIMLGWIAVFALAVRLEDVNWDEGQHLHPDERFLSIVESKIRGPDGIGEYFDSKESPLNPYQHEGRFVYGTLPLFVNKAVAEWLDRDEDRSTHRTADWFRGVLGAFGVGLEHDDGSLIFDGGYGSNLVGRVLSALVDVATVLLLFELGRVLFNRRVGLLAAGLLSITVLHIQHAHFFGSEAFLGFFVTATIYFSVRIWKYGSGWNYALAGLAFGLALATKLSSLPVLAIPTLAIAMRMWPQIEALYRWAFGVEAPWRSAAAPSERLAWSTLLSPVLLGIMGLAVAGLAFRIAQPYAFASRNFFDVLAFDLDLRDDVFSFGAIRHLEFLKPTHYFNFDQRYRNDIGGLLQEQKGADFPPNIQWIGRTPFLFPLQNIVIWGLGLPLALAVGGGMVLVAWRVVRHRDLAGVLPAVWVVLLFLFLGRGFNPTMRYFLPMYPAMVLVAAYGLVSLWDYASSEQARSALRGRLAALAPYVPAVCRAAIVASVGGTLLWALAFVGVYRQDISRVQATYWMAENVPDGSYVSFQEWDDGLPLGLGLADPAEVQHVAFKPYVPDSDENKVEELVGGLDQADYVVESSNRLYGTIPRFPARWPSTILYYQYLFDGTLGFEKVAEFTNYPRLFGVDIPDQGAEEAFSVYDHPKVTIWKKTPAFSRERALELLRPEKSGAAIDIAPSKAHRNALQFTPEVLDRQREGGTWTDIFDTSSATNDHPLIFWLLVMELSAFALAPMALIVFRALPDRGFLLTKPLGILGLSYAAYAPSSYGVLDYTRGTIALGLALMLIAGIVVGYRWRSELIAWVRERWRFLLFCEAFFLLVFLAGYWLRLQNPDLWHPARGGEKPMDLAYLQGVLRTTDMTQGPIDPWQAGGYLNYYYYGQFISATLTKLTGIVPEVAYNLIVPMFLALAAAAAFSVTYNLTETVRLLLRRRPGLRPIGRSGPIVAALLGVFLALFAGNLASISELERTLSSQSPWNPDIPLIGGAITIIGGLKEVAFGDATLRDVSYQYNWWTPSRALSADPGEVAPITEFPYWTFLFADLHAHLMSIPFALTAVGVGLAAVLTFSRLNPQPPHTREGSRSRDVSAWVMVAVLGLIAGSLRWINSWDYPPFLLLGAAALFIAERAKYGRFTLRGMVMGGVKSAVMAGLSFGFFLPFISNYQPFYNGVNQSRQTSDLSEFTSHFGILMSLVAGFVIFMLVRALTRDRLSQRLFFGSSRRRVLADAAPVLSALVLAGMALTWAGSLERWGVTMLSIAGVVAIALCAVRELRSPSPAAPILLFVYAMAALGAGLTGGVEMFTLEGDIGRMNTVFKFYLHVWFLWGIVAAFGLWYMFAVARPHAVFMRRAGALHRSLVEAPRYAFGGTAVILLVLALAFTYFGTRSRLHDRYDPAQGTGNNGMEYMDGAVWIGGDYSDDEQELKYDRDGIWWLREHVQGTPAIIEGLTPIYHSGSRMSIYTGLPDVLGWDWHQKQQRGDFGLFVDRRREDVNMFYTTTDITSAREVIKRYDVEYVIVGQVERNYYPAAGIEKFNSGLGGALELAYQNPGLQIWHVIPADELGAQAAAGR